MHKLTIFGVLSAVLVTAVPFATTRQLFFGAVSTKYFLVVAVVLALAGAAAYLYFQGKKTLHLRERPLLWTGLGLLAAYWLAALLGIFPERSVFSDLPRSSGVFFLTHLAVFALLLGEFLTARDWVVLRRTVAVSAGIFAFCTLLGAEGLGFSGRVLFTNFEIGGFTFGNSTFAGTYLLLALIIGLVELVRTPRLTSWWYALAGSCALIFFSPILFNIGALMQLSIPLGSARASSAAAIAFLTFLGGYWLIKNYASKARYALLGWAAALVLFVGGGVTLLLTPGSFVQDWYIGQSTGARLLVWQSGFEAFKERPVLGFGPENVEVALQKHFDNRLFQDDYIGEIWFDRAHNVIVDTLVQVGAVGVAAHLACIGAFVWVVYRARKRDLVGEPEAMVLYALPLAHVLQLQTGFDTIGSYVLLGVLGGYGLWLERGLVARESGRQERDNQAAYYKAGAGVLGVLVLVSAYLLYTEFSRQSALYKIFVTTNAEERLGHIETATSRPSSFESLRLSSLSLVKGTLSAIAEGRANRATLDDSLMQLKVYENRYREYLELQPEYYRAHMALAYLLSVERVLGGENKLEEAKELVSKGYELSPNNLLTPTMEALLELYSGNLVLAKQKAQAVVELNPQASLSKEALTHIEKQEKTFPVITVLELENL